MSVKVVEKAVKLQSGEVAEQCFPLCINMRQPGYLTFQLPCESWKGAAQLQVVAATTALVCECGSRWALFFAWRAGNVKVRGRGDPPASKCPMYNAYSPLLYYINKANVALSLNRALVWQRSALTIAD